MENINLNEKESKAQSAQILKALKNGEKLTHLDAERRFNCLRLGARIYDLKRKGYPIETEMITVPSGKRVAQYSMVVRYGQ
ncbi:TPA: helix-turn-helix domain-containing protein [Pasteurella multocida]